MHDFRLTAAAQGCAKHLCGFDPRSVSRSTTAVGAFRSRNVSDCNRPRPRSSFVPLAGRSKSRAHSGEVPVRRFARRAGSRGQSCFRFVRENAGAVRWSNQSGQGPGASRTGHAGSSAKGLEVPHRIAPKSRCSPCRSRLASVRPRAPPHGPVLVHPASSRTRQ
jgi:hypothetical protein